jgi:hypothetical protein
VSERSALTGRIRSVVRRLHVVAVKKAVTTAPCSGYTSCIIHTQRPHISSPENGFDICALQLQLARFPHARGPVGYGCCWKGCMGRRYSRDHLQQARLMDAFIRPHAAALPSSLSQIVATPAWPRSVNLVNRLDRAVPSACRDAARACEMEPERRAGCNCTATG